MTQQEKTELWTARIDDYLASGERAVDWCERHQVTTRQLWYWLRKRKKSVQEEATTAGRPQWIALHLDEPATDGAAPILVKVAGAIIEVRPGFDPSLFTDVVRALKDLC